MREALRMALREEMLRDDKVFVMGEEVGIWQGTHRVTQGLLEEFGARRVIDRFMIRYPEYAFGLLFLLRKETA